MQHPELLKSLFLHEPGAIASFVTNPADAKAVGEDRVADAEQEVRRHRRAAELGEIVSRWRAGE